MLKYDDIQKANPFLCNFGLHYESLENFKGVIIITVPFCVLVYVEKLGYGHFHRTFHGL